MFLTIKLCTEQIIYIKMDLALNNLQRLICHKTKQTKLYIYIYIYIYMYIYIYIYIYCTCSATNPSVT